MKEKLRLIGRLYLFIFIVWGLYRLVFRLPDDIEEIILKPMVWLLPTFYIVFKIEKRQFSSLGYSLKNFGPSIIKGLLLGFLFLFVGLGFNYLKNGGVFFNAFPAKEVFLPALILSFVTAISEETVFRGYIMNRLWEITKSSTAANLVSSIGFSLIHLPIIVFAYHYSLPQIFIYLALILLTSLGSGLAFSWTNTIWASILIHVFWSWPVMLLR